MKTLIAEPAPEAFCAHTAIFIYAASEQHVVARRHAVQEIDGRLVLGAGTFVTRAAIESLVAEIDSRSLHFIPDHVLASTSSSVAWWVPEGPRTMFFKPAHDHALAAFDGKTIAQPPLLFIARKHSLYVYALLENQRPTPSSPVAYPPYWNIFGNDTYAQVCVGDVPFPKTHDPLQTAAWTDAFFGSNFTHGEYIAHAYPGSYAELLAAAIAAKTFKREWLRPKNTTVGDVLCGG
jgi:PRTRC genetic system protein B